MTIRSPAAEARPALDTRRSRSFLHELEVSLVDPDLARSGQIVEGTHKLNRPDFRSVLQARMELDEQEVFAGDA
jgi:hypothetical protein